MRQEWRSSSWKRCGGVQMAPFVTSWMALSSGSPLWWTMSPDWCQAGRSPLLLAGILHSKLHLWFGMHTGCSNFLNFITAFFYKKQHLFFPFQQQQLPVQENCCLFLHSLLSGACMLSGTAFVCGRSHGGYCPTVTISQSWWCYWADFSFMHWNLAAVLLLNIRL